MAEDKVQVRNPRGETVQGTIVEIESSDERFNTLVLGDGRVLKVKHVVAEVIRVDGETDPEGNPVYLIKGGNVVHLVTR